MLNYLMNIQCFLIFIIIFLYWLTDLSFLLIVGIVYLFILSGLCFYLETDILICFLIIIDLGVFFILLAFTIHFLKYINKKYLFINSVKNVFIVLILIFLLLGIVLFTFNPNFIQKLSYNWIFFLNYINYTATHQIIWLSEMQLFKEIFFNFNSFEFILISILLFIDLLCIFFLYKILYKITSNSLKSYNFDKIDFIKLGSVYFFKTQNYFNQYKVPAVSRVFKKIKHDTKTNNTTNNR